MVDFSALPPEINSARMYTGAGAGPLTAAAAAWDKLATELSSAAQSFRAIVAELTGETWFGPASAAMTAAVTPYVEWMNATAAQAAHTAGQARAAAAAYQTAFAAMVPPPVIAANRAALTSLVTNNIFGQNTAAIAANQAQYTEMWTQDATAMHGYVAHSAAATALTKFVAPAAQSQPEFDHVVGQFGFNNLSLQAIVNSLLPTFGNIPMPTLPSSNPFSLIFDLFYSPLWLNSSAWLAQIGLSFSQFTGWQWGTQAILQLVQPLMMAALAFPPYTEVMSAHGMPAGALGSTLVSSESALGASSLAGLRSAQMSASLGRAAAVGGLSVPQAWGAAAPETPRTAAALPAAGAAALPAAGPAGASGPTGGLGGLGGLGGMAGMAGMPMLGSVVNTPKTDGQQSKYHPRPAVMAAMPGEKPGRDNTSGGSAVETGNAELSDREREELEVLRREVAEMRGKRDEATRLVREAIRS